MFKKDRDNMIEAGILSTEKTFGREKNKLLYQCRPYGGGEPVLIPYQQKNLSFSKSITKFYVLFRRGGEGQCIMQEMIGNAQDTSNYYKYELWANQLGTNPTRKMEKNLPSLEEPTATHSYSHVFTIDPEGSRDFDDAFAVTTLSERDWIVHVFIANVPRVLEMYGLWPHVSDRMSTIYLPDKTYPIFPRKLSEDFCSLREGTVRYCFVMNVRVETNKITEIDFDCQNVFISKNYDYLSTTLQKNKSFQQLLALTSILNHGEPLTSKEMVEYWMIRMNETVAQRLPEGMLRTTVSVQQTTTPSWKGMYVPCATRMSTWHEPLQLKRYTHVTSPIRRFVDVMNLTLFQNFLQCTVFSQTTLEWVRQFIQEKCDFLNFQVDRIKKVQNRCAWIKVCEHRCPFETTGQVLEIQEPTDTTGQYEALFYFPKENLYKKYKSCYSVVKVGGWYLVEFYYVEAPEWHNKIRIMIKKEVENKVKQGK